MASRSENSLFSALMIGRLAACTMAVAAALRAEPKSRECSPWAERLATKSRSKSSATGYRIPRLWSSTAGNWSGARRWTPARAKYAATSPIAPKAPLGPHILRALTADGPSTSAIFNVGQFPAVLEAEPNDSISKAQESAPAGRDSGKLDGAADADTFAITCRRGERKLFDLRAIEQGSAVEARMILFDPQGSRIEFNDDRDDYDENPLIEHTFAQDGTYYVKLDQYGARAASISARIALTCCAFPTCRWSDTPARWACAAEDRPRCASRVGTGGRSQSFLATAAGRIRPHDISLHHAHPVPPGSAHR